MTSIVFEEVSAEIPPTGEADAATAGASDRASEKQQADAPDPVEQLRRARALLREREARLAAD